MLPTRDAKKFLHSMQSIQDTGDVEKGVENAVGTLLQDYYTAKYAKDHGVTVTLTHPHNTDGVLSVEGSLFSDNKDAFWDVLIETKNNLDFSGKRSDLCQVLCQVVYYLHTLSQDLTRQTPAVTVIADSDEIFAIPTVLLTGHLTKDHNWSIAPSEAFRSNPVLFTDLMNDKNIRPHIYDIFSPAFDPAEFCAYLHNMGGVGTPEKIKVTPKNLEKAFINFSFDVLGGPGSGITNRKQIEIFIRSLKGDDNIFIQPKKNNVLSMDGKEFTGVDEGAFDYFLLRHDSNAYGLSEIKKITEIADTLIEEVDRRFSGDFWTPKIWVDRAHEMITADLGENWCDNYVVWDPAAGAKNLTRDYRFDRLYSSTLHPEELSFASDYNTDNIAFTHDFLNDDIVMLSMTRDQIEETLTAAQESDEQAFSIPNELVQDLLDKKPFVFFANPPYGQSGSGQGKDHKADVSTTKIGEMMVGLGHARMEMYTQFIYRVQKMTEVFEYGTDDEMHFFFFNKTFLTSPNFAKFTDNLYSQFTFTNGFMINAGEFSGTSSAWGVIFSHNELGGSNQTSFDYEVLRSTKEGSIEKVCDWTGKVSTGTTISDWFKNTLGAKDTSEKYPVTTNGFDASTTHTYVKRTVGEIGYLHNTSSNIQNSDKYCGMFTIPFSRNRGGSITENNLPRSAITFSIRRAVYEQIAVEKKLWIRDKDVFTAPSAALLTDEFTADCIVYSLFDKQSCQTSLRGFSYNGSTYRVVNEFFPFSHEFITDLASTHNAYDIEVDADADTDRIMYTWLEDHDADLSTEARSLLDIVKELYVDSFALRTAHSHAFSRYQVGSWDAGWVQIRTMIFGRDRFNDSLLSRKDTFTTALRALGNTIATQSMDDGVI